MQTTRATECPRTLYPRLADGDMTVVSAFADKATVDSPLGGKQLPAEFVTDARSWLERHAARIEEVHTVAMPGRVIHELELCVTADAPSRRCRLPAGFERQDQVRSHLR